MTGFLVSVAACLSASSSVAPEFRGASASLKSSLGVLEIDGASPSRPLAVAPFGWKDNWSGITYTKKSPEGSLQLFWDLAWNSSGRLLARLRAANRGAKPISLLEAQPFKFLRRGNWKGGTVLQFDPFLFGYNTRMGLEPLIEEETKGGVYATAASRPSLVGGFLSTNKTFGRTYVTPREGGLDFCSVQPVEGALLNPGAEREFEWLYVSLRQSPQAELERFGALMVKANQPKKRFDPTAAWCTWYSSFVWPKSLNGELERFALANIPEAAAFLSFGLDRIRVVEDAPFSGPLDYPLHSDALPGGYAAVVKAAAAKGLRVGVWFDNTRSYVTSDASRQHPEWFAKGPDGRPNRRETAKGYPDHYILDPTTTGGEELYAALPRRFRTTGIDYAFGDFTWNGLVPPDQSHDATLTSVEALRRGMLAFRQGLGEDAYWLTQQLHGANWDLVDAFRISVDSWGNQPASYRNSRGLWFLNHRMFLCDPDAWRPSVLTLPWAEAWLSWQVLGGHPITIGGDLRQFTRRQREILRRALPTLKTPSVPLDLWERRTGFGSAQSFAKGDLKWTALQLCNFRKSPVSLSLKPNQPVLVRSFWTGAFLGRFTGAISRRLEGGTGETLMLYQDLQRPQIVGVGDHLEQGAVSLVDSSWDSRTRTLTATVKPFSMHEPLEVLVFAPDGWKIAKGQAVQSRRVAGGWLTTMIPEGTGDCEVSLRFDSGSDSEVSAPKAPWLTMTASAILSQASASSLQQNLEDREFMKAVPEPRFDTEPMNGAAFWVETGDLYRFPRPFSKDVDQAVWHHDSELLFRIAPDACRGAKGVIVILADPDSEARKVDVRIGLGDGSKLKTAVSSQVCMTDQNERVKQVWLDLPKDANRKGVRVSVLKKHGVNAAVAGLRLAKERMQAGL